MLKKAGHRLVELAAVMLLAGCQYDGVVTDLRNETGGQDIPAISFGNGLIDAPTYTRANYLLSEHMNTMGVWGWQTTKDGEVGCLFNNHEVTFNPTFGKWIYSPQKYWEEGSSYRFYAYAPHGNTVDGATVSIDNETGRISIQDVTLRGSNTMSTSAQPQPYGNFSSVDDTDWMIDRAGRVVHKEQIRNTVTFNMQHILAKFNVMVKTNGAVTSAGTTVVLDSMSIGTFLSKGSFSQKLDHSPVADNPTDMAAAEWTIDTTHPRYTLQSTRGATVDADGCCVIESLLLPQDITAGQQVRIDYTLHSENGRAEHFIYLFDLQETGFEEFRCAHNYTLNIIIGPDVIKFDAGSTQWDNEPAIYETIN